MTMALGNAAREQHSDIGAANVQAALTLHHCTGNFSVPKANAHICLVRFYLSHTSPQMVAMPTPAITQLFAFNFGILQEGS